MAISDKHQHMSAQSYLAPIGLPGAV